jgi:hypothetical protein
VTNLAKNNTYADLDRPEYCLNTFHFTISLLYINFPECKLLKKFASLIIASFYHK